MFSGALSAPVTTRHATPADAAILAELAASTFRDTFAIDNDPRDMELYCANAFSEPVQRAELEASHHVILIAERNGTTAGYAMLREGPAPECVRARDAIEIVRLYSVKQYIGAGVGAALMQRCLDTALERGRDTMWLGVWEHNVRAIAFYKRWGYVDVGSHIFVLGRDRQTDRIMTRPVVEH